MATGKIKQDLTIELKFETDQWKRQTSSAQQIIIIAEGIHNSVNSPDREITFMATISKLL